MNKWHFSDISDFKQNLKQDGFNIYEIKTEKNIVCSYHRKDFFKLLLINGKCTIHYANKEIGIEGSTLFVAKPHIPYSCHIISNDKACYTCLITEDFLKGGCFGEHQHSQLFEIESARLFSLNNEQGHFLTTIFQKMIVEQSTAYVFRDDLIRNHISLIIHEAFKTQSPEGFMESENSASNAATLFIELLERQFPIEAQIVFWN